jgi:hypothetical protein
VVIKKFQSLNKFFVYSGRWLKILIPEKYASLLGLDKFTIGRCGLLLYLVPYS